MKNHIAFAAMALGVVMYSLQGCKPYEEEGIVLPGAPVASISWSFIDAVDSLGQVVGIDSNRVELRAEDVEGSFLQLWDFGNGQTSDKQLDTATTRRRKLRSFLLGAHAGGMGLATDVINIEQTLELPCEGTLALLTGCDSQKTWKLSNEAGAISVGRLRTRRNGTHPRLTATPNGRQMTATSLRKTGSISTTTTGVR